MAEHLNFDIRTMDDELTIVHPETGEERFLITNGDVVDLRVHSHNHVLDGAGCCLICNLNETHIKDNHAETNSSSI